jgi:NAD(P)H-hydrate epimerase
MQRAGAAAAGEITARFAERLARGVLVLAGPGNNGGDGWVIARALAAAGVDVSVFSPELAKSSDCIAERDLAAVHVQTATAYEGQGVVIDALLGIGSSGAPRGAIAKARDLIGLARRRDAVVVAVDLPSGLDATTGESNDAAAADITLTFGAFKRGHLVTRGLCGAVVVLDIGFLPTLDGIEVVTGEWVRRSLPAVTAGAHKGTRKKLLVHGGAPGMVGAVILAVRAALASGIGMVKARVHESGIAALHAAVPQALVDTSGDDTAEEWADALVIGPGLGIHADTPDIVSRAVRRQRGPVLLDADALNAFAGKAGDLRGILAGRTALLTPHPVECARLLSVDPSVVLKDRFEIGARLAAMTGAVVLLKGVPTIISAPDGRRIVIAEGTPVLAAGGSGDILCGIAGTLLAQMDDAFTAAACAAFIHGCAARLSGAFIRGTTLDDVLGTLPNAWRLPGDLPRYPILAELPAIPAQ